MHDPKSITHRHAGLAGAPIRRRLQSALASLRAHVEAADLRGHDPYDLLASRFPLRRLGRRACFVLSQLHKRSPIDFRSVLRIPELRAPKAMGLFLGSYAALARYEASGRITRSAGEEAETRLQSIFGWLMANAGKSGAGIYWGLPFAYASRVEMIGAGAPSLVVTAFVHRGISAYYAQTGDPAALRALRSCCDFVLADLPRFEDGDGLCFAYTPTNPLRCYNATMLAAEMLARTWSMTGETDLLDPARRTVEFVLAKQHPDGHWAYAMLPDGREREQIDFHQGFVLCSLQVYAACSGDGDPRVRAALESGAAYYRRVQFEDNGRSLWRIPRRFPTDIHHQAQGILTFSELAELADAYLPFAQRIALWTIQNMQTPQGYFVHRRGRWFTNRLDYIRWGQAWMMSALIALLEKIPARCDP